MLEVRLYPQVHLSLDTFPTHFVILESDSIPDCISIYSPDITYLHSLMGPVQSRHCWGTMATSKSGIKRTSWNGRRKASFEGLLGAGSPVVQRFGQSRTRPTPLVFLSHERGACVLIYVPSHAPQMYQCPAQFFPSIQTRGRMVT